MGIPEYSYIKELSRMGERKSVRIGLKIILTFVIWLIYGAIRAAGGGWIFVSMLGVGIVAIWRWKPSAND